MDHNAEQDLILGRLYAELASVAASPPPFALVSPERHLELVHARERYTQTLARWNEVLDEKHRDKVPVVH